MTDKNTVGAIAVQQALRVRGVSYEAISKIVGVHPRTVWQHVAARRGSNVRAWEDRSAEEREAALERADELVEMAEVSGIL